MFFVRDFQICTCNEMISKSKFLKDPNLMHWVISDTLSYGQQTLRHLSLRVSKDQKSWHISSIGTWWNKLEIDLQIYDKNIITVLKWTIMTDILRFCIVCSLRNDPIYVIAPVREIHVIQVRGILDHIIYSKSITGWSKLIFTRKRRY